MTSWLTKVKKAQQNTTLIGLPNEVNIKTLTQLPSWLYLCLRFFKDPCTLQMKPVLSSNVWYLNLYCWTWFSCLFLTVCSRHKTFTYYCRVSLVLHVVMLTKFWHCILKWTLSNIKGKTPLHFIPLVFEIPRFLRNGSVESCIWVNN